MSLSLGLSGGSACQAAEAPEFHITIKNHRYQPSTLVVPANRRVRLIVRNADPAAEEFESYKLNREKVIPGNSTATINIGPLRPGRYPFIGEFHEATAKGAIIAK